MFGRVEGMLQYVVYSSHLDHQLLIRTHQAYQEGTFPAETFKTNMSTTARQSKKGVDDVMSTNKRLIMSEIHNSMTEASPIPIIVNSEIIFA